MKLGWTLLAVGALLFVVSAIVGDDGQVSDIARMDKSELRRSAAEVAVMGGFSEDSDLGLLAKEAQNDRADEPARTTPRASEEAPIIGDFAGVESRRRTPSPAAPPGQAVQSAQAPSEIAMPVRRADVAMPDWPVPENTPVAAALPSPPRYAASRTGAYKVKRQNAPKSPGED